MRFRWLVLAFAGCLNPTEVTIRLTSDACDAIAETNIFLGDSTSASASTTCPSGSLVMIPARERDATFRVRVTACDKAKTHCITASRRVGFVPHTPLELPIAIDRSCMDVVCTPDQTCSKGGCVSDDVSKSCGGNVCQPLPPDGGGPPPPSCSPPYANAPGGGSTPHVWHFDGLPVIDQAKLCAQAPAIEIGPGMNSACGSAAVDQAYDGGASWAKSLGCASNAGAGTSFHVALWFRVPSKSAMLVQKIDTSKGGGSGWALDMSVVGVLQFVARDPMMPTVQITIGPQMMPGTWHSAEFATGPTSFKAWVDKSPVTSMSGLPIGPSPMGEILIGPLTDGAVDELWIYP